MTAYQFPVIQSKPRQTDWVSWFRWRQVNDQKYLDALETRIEDGRVPESDEKEFYVMYGRASNRVKLNQQLVKANALMPPPYRMAPLSPVQRAYLHQLILTFRIHWHLDQRWSNPKFQYLIRFVCTYIRERYFLHDHELTHNDAARRAARDDTVRQFRSKVSSSDSARKTD